MRLKMAMLAGAVLACAEPAEAQRRLGEVYRITEGGDWVSGGLDQTLSISAPWNVYNPKRWIVERVRREYVRWAACTMGRCTRSDVTKHNWIDSDTCPALVTALDELAKIQIPPFAGTRAIFEFAMSHTPVLTIEGLPRHSRPGLEPRYGGTTLERIRVSEQVGYFREWWDRTEAALKPCWRDAAPNYGGKPVQARLTTVRRSGG